MSLFSGKTKNTKKKPAAKTGSGGLKSVQKFNWKRNTPIIAIVALAGGYLLWHSFAGTERVYNQYSIQDCKASLTRGSKFMLYTNGSNSPKQVTTQTCQDLSSEAMVYRVYEGVSKRQPDLGGYQYWTQQLAGNRTKPDTLVNSLYYSQMGANLSTLANNTYNINYDRHDPTSFVKNAYTAVLGRPADKSGLDYWVNRLQHGKDNPNHVIASLAATSEGHQQFVKNAYQQLLGRKVDPAGLNYWTAQLNSKKITTAKLVQQLAGSKEGKTYFVNTLYKNFLGRKADAGGLAYWSAKPSSNDLYRAALINQFIETHEGATNFVNSLYKGFYSRKADSTGLKYWVGRLTQNTNRASRLSPTAVMVAFANSTEAQNYARKDFLAYQAKNPSPTIIPVAANLQAQRTQQMQALSGAAASENKYYIAPAKIQANQDSTVVQTQAGYSGDKQSQATLNSMQANINDIVKQQQTIQQHAQAQSDDYNKIVVLEGQALPVNAYSPDISIANATAMYKAATMNEIHARDTATSAVQTYASKANQALTTARNNYIAYQAQLNAFYTAVATNQKNQADCTNAGNSWNAWTNVCTALQQTAAPAGGSSGNGSSGSNFALKIVQSYGIGFTCKQAVNGVIASLKGVSPWKVNDRVYYCNTATSQAIDVQAQGSPGVGKTCVSIWSVNGKFGSAVFNSGYTSSNFPMSVDNTKLIPMTQCGSSHNFTSDNFKYTATITANSPVYVQLGASW